MFENVSVKEWMVSPVITVEAASPLSAAHHLMKNNGVRRLPVINNNKLAGIITIGDVREASPSDATTLSIWELNYLWAQLTCEKIMTRDLLTEAHRDRRAGASRRAGRPAGAGVQDRP